MKTKYFRNILLLTAIIIIVGGCAKNRHGVFPSANKWLAITFNDGPSGNTETLLNIMKDNDMKVTFFVSGFNFNRDIYEPVIKRMIDEGHEISHSAFTRVNLGDETSRQPIRENIRRAQDLVREVTGKENRYFRPHQLSRNNLVNDVVHELGLVYIGGYNTNDWDFSVGPSTLIEDVVKNARNGQIIILHDFGNNNTVEAFADLVWELRKRGFGFLTVTELAQRKRVNLIPGRWYDRF